MKPSDRVVVPRYIREHDRVARIVRVFKAKGDMDVDVARVEFPDGHVSIVLLSHCEPAKE